MTPQKRVEVWRQRARKIRDQTHGDYSVLADRQRRIAESYEIMASELEGDLSKPEVGTPEWEQQVHDARPLQDLAYHIIYNALAPADAAPRTDPDAIAHACSLAIEAAFERLARVGVDKVMGGR